VVFAASNKKASVGSRVSLRNMRLMGFIGVLLTWNYP